MGSGRVIEVKARTLGQFWAEHAGKTTASIMGEWNTLYPDWAYEDAQRFKWEAQVAVQRLQALFFKRLPRCPCCGAVLAYDVTFRVAEDDG